MSSYSSDVCNATSSSTRTLLSLAKITARLCSGLAQNLTECCIVARWLHAYIVPRDFLELLDERIKEP